MVVDASEAEGSNSGGLEVRNPAKLPVVLGLYFIRLFSSKFLDYPKRFGLNIWVILCWPNGSFFGLDL